MPYPKRLLHVDEDVIVDVRPHPIRLVRPVLFAFAILGGVVAGFVSWTSAPVWFAWVLLAALGLDVVVFGAKYIGWRSTNLVLTSSRVVYRRGVIQRYGREIPISRVQDVTYHQGLFERFVGAGSLTVESAGEGGSEAFDDVRHPEEIQGLINRALDANRHRSEAPVAEAVPDVVGQIDKLAELHRRGVITDFEFESKKAELLGRL